MELTNYEQYQLNKYGNILPEPLYALDGEVYESGAGELERHSEWVEQQADRQLRELEF